MVSISSWEELMAFSNNSNNTNGDLEGDWSGPDVIDFDELDIGPFYGTVYIRGRINFRGVIFRNMTWYQKGNDGCLRFVVGGPTTASEKDIKKDCTKNLVIENLLYEPTGVESQGTIIYMQSKTSSWGHVEKCKFTIKAVCSCNSASTVAVYCLNSPSNVELCAKECSFNVEAVSANGSVSLTANSTVFRDCQFDVNIKANSTNASICYGGLTNCLVRGKIENTSTSSNAPVPNFNSSLNKFNNYLLEGSYSITSTAGKSIYDNTNMTLTNVDANMIGYDPDNVSMADLKAAGFPCYA